MTTGTIQIQAKRPGLPLLEPRFAALKKSLVKPEHREKVEESYGRLCRVLASDAEFIRKTGPAMVPEIDFNSLFDETSSQGPVELPPAFADLVRERGCVVLRNVVPEAQATAWEAELIEYTRTHPNVGGFPVEDPQNWSLWWTRPQVQIRSHPRVLAAMACVSRLWHVADPSLPVDLGAQVMYPDRFRIRHPSPNEAYTLPAHLDSGAIERWEDPANRANFAAIFEGNWQGWDGWEAGGRIHAASDLYSVEAACTCWRSLQGWLSLSHTNTGEGTLRLLPNLKASVAYCMLRPLFGNSFAEKEGTIDDSQPTFPGSTPGCTQFFPTRDHHPHLDLDKSMIGIPPVRPGDYVFWHCDLVHEVDRFHPGTTNSSVVYNACSPLTPYNIDSLVGNRAAFAQAMPPPDFELSEYGREQECDHADHGARQENVLCKEGLQALGLAPFDANAPGLTEGEREIRRLANEKLGF
ncbi:hypothetical protein SEUCBS139899_003936 [Sporothrix eucalyptigena]